MSAFRNLHPGTQEFSDFRVEPQISVRNTFIDVRDQSPPAVERSKTSPSIFFDSRNACESPVSQNTKSSNICLHIGFENLESMESENVQEDSAASDTFKLKDTEEAGQGERCAAADQSGRLETIINSHIHVSEETAEFKFNVNATPFFPDEIVSCKTGMPDSVPLCLMNDVRDLSATIETLDADVRMVADVRMLSKVIGDDALTSTSSTEARNFMAQVLNSLHDVNKSKPMQSLENTSVQQMAARTLKVPDNTPAAWYSQGDGASPSNRFAMGFYHCEEASKCEFV